MADTLISPILKQLASLAEQEVRSVVGVEKEVEKITCNLRTIQAVLEDAERRQVKDDAVRQWLDKLKDVSYDMDDLLDEWNSAILKTQIKGDEKETVCSFIHSCFCFIYSCFCYREVVQRRDIAIKIKELNERLDVIVDEKRNFHFTLMRGNEEIDRRMTISIVDVSEVHGRDEDKNTVVDMLLSESSQGPTFHIISVVGMGGIGKTTLAQIVYNDDTVKGHFLKRIWVCVSDPFDEVRIAKAIFEALEGRAPDSNELESLFQHIQQSVEGKKFLLILDDVWTEDYQSLEQLKNSLKCCSPGSKILVTTRKETVANNIGTIKIFRLGQLSNEECWSLFSKVAFFGSSDKYKNLEDIGRGIVDKCKGLPLAAKVLGSLLRFKNTRKEWQSVLNSEVWKLEEAKEGIFPPLLLSYYELSSTMRQCFSYCAIFPKDYEIEKDMLIKLWMAQGYLRVTCSKDMEIVGEECFENLAMCSFFQDFNRDENGSIISCKMHDIVHDFAQFLTKNECFVMEVNDSEESMLSHVKARHSMLMLATGVSIPASIKYVKNLRSLVIEWKDLPMTSAALYEILDQLKCLRTLNLSEVVNGFSLTEVPKEVGKLIHLRYLNFAGNSKLKELPDTVCDLCNLQSLNVSWCESLAKLPHGLGKLINLRYLENFGTDLSSMPKGVERLSCLRTLDTFYVSSGVNDSEASTLEGLKNLNELRGELRIERLGNVRDVDEVKKAQLENKKHLIKLRLDFRGEEAEGRKINDELVIEAMQPPPNLEELSICGYRGKSMCPSWMMSLTNLKKFVITDCENCEVLLRLGKLSSLESLEIDSMKSAERVGTELLGIESEVNKIDNCPKLKALPDHLTIMPSLHSLTIIRCPKLKALPDDLLHKCPSLQKLWIHDCSILQQRYHNGWRKGEEWPNISHIPNIIINREYGQRDGQPEG